MITYGNIKIITIIQHNDLRSWDTVITTHSTTQLLTRDSLTSQQGTKTPLRQPLRPLDPFPSQLMRRDPRSWVTEAASTSNPRVVTNWPIWITPYWSLDTAPRTVKITGLSRTAGQPPGVIKDTLRWPVIETINVESPWKPATLLFKSFNFDFTHSVRLEQYKTIWVTAVTRHFIFLPWFRVYIW